MCSDTFTSGRLTLLDINPVDLLLFKISLIFFFKKKHNLMEVKEVSV